MVESTVKNAHFFCKRLIVCICSFHNCFGLLQLVVCDIFEVGYEGLWWWWGIIKRVTRTVVTKFWVDARNSSSNFQTSLFNFKNAIEPSLLPSSFNAISSPPPTIHPHVIHPPLSNIEVGIIESKKEVRRKWLVGKKSGRTTKEWSRKVRKMDIIEVGESDEAEMGRVKWKDFEVHQLIAIRGEMEDEFARSSNKQGKFLKKYNFFF